MGSPSSSAGRQVAGRDLAAPSWRRSWRESGVTGSVYGVPQGQNTHLAGQHIGTVPHNCF